MRFRQKVLEWLTKTEAGARFVTERRYRMVVTAGLGFLLNLTYALYHGALGIMDGSVWFMTMCAYYIILSTMRFSAVLCERRSGQTPSVDTEYFVMRLSGVLLVGLSIVLSGVVCISLSRNIAAKHGEIVMIAIAAYTFYKLTMAVIRAVRQRRDPSPLLAVIRNIGYADVAASVLTLQRSMLVSFQGMSAWETRLMNALTGAAVSLFVAALGIAMIIRGLRKGA